MIYFDGCYTIDEIKSRYRKWSMMLHPDVGGKAELFLEMKQEYDGKIDNVSRQPLLPEYFNPRSDYEYFRRPVKYLSRDNHYYRFEMQSGCGLLIDRDHLNLIWEKQKRI